MEVSHPAVAGWGWVHCWTSGWGVGWVVGVHALAHVLGFHVFHVLGFQVFQVAGFQVAGFHASPRRAESRAPLPAARRRRELSVRS